MKTILKDGTTLHSHNLPDFISREIKKHKNFYEYKLLNKLKEMNVFGDGDIIEIGANIGNHVIFYKTQLDRDMKVFAFEPLKDNYEILEKNIKSNKLSNVFVNKFGVGPSSKELTFFVNENNYGNSSLYEQTGTSKETKVEIKEVLSSLKPIIKTSTFAKVDIEGAEKPIFKKLVEVFNKKNFRFLIEIYPNSSESAEEYISYFRTARRAGLKLTSILDPANFLFSSYKEDADLFDEAKLRELFLFHKIRNFKSSIRASKSKSEVRSLLREIKISLSKIGVPFKSKLFLAKIYVFFSFKWI